MTNEEHINGLKVIKPFLQKKMLEINYEGMGELDAKEVGETIDASIKALEALEKADKYRWHDITENADDLPEIDGTYLVSLWGGSIDLAEFMNDWSEADKILGNYEGRGFRLWDGFNEKFTDLITCVAWKRIEGF